MVVFTMVEVFNRGFLYYPMLHFYMLWKKMALNKRIFRLAKWSLPAFLLILLFCLVGLLIFIQRPISSPVVDRLIQRAWNDATGLPLSYKKATFRIAKGQADLTDIRIQNPQVKGNLVRIQNLRLHWEWLPDRWARPFLLSSIQMSGIESIKIYLDSRMRPVLDERGKAVQEFLRRLEKRPKEHRQSMVARDLRVEIDDVPILVFQIFDDQTRLLSTLRMATMTYRRGTKGGGWSIGGKALLKGVAHASQINFMVGLNEEKGPLKFSIDGDSLHVPDQFMAGPSIVGSTGPFACEGSVRLSGKNAGTALQLSVQTENLRSLHQPTSGTLDVAIFKIDATLTFDDRTLQWNYNLSARDLSSLPRPGTQTLTLEGIQSGGQGVYNGDTRTVRLNRFVLRALDSQVRMTGRLSLREPCRFESTITDAFVSPGALDWIQHALPDGSPNLHFSKGSMRGQMQFAGNRNGVDWKASRGGVSFGNVQASSNRLSKPILLTGDATWSPITLALPKLQLDTEGNRLVLQGKLDRQVKAPKKGMEFHANWKANLDPRQLLGILPKNQIDALGNLDIDGKLQGTGTVSGEWKGTAKNISSDAGSTSSKEAIWSALVRDNFQVNGQFQLDIAHLDHPALPGPIKGLKGGLDLRNKSVEFRRLKAEMLDSSITLSGSVKGEPYFWSRNAQADLAGVGTLDLSRAAAAVGGGSQKRVFFDRLRPEGRLAGDLHLRGPVYEPQKTFVTGDLEAQSVSCRIDSRFTQGELRQANALLHFLPDRLIIDDLRGKIRTVDFSTTGTVFPNSCDLDFATAGFLTDYRSIAPNLITPRLDLAGQATLNGRLMLRMKQAASQAVAARPIRSFWKSLDAAIGSVQWQGVTPAALDEQFEWDLSGALRLEDATIAHMYAPAPTTHVYGDFILEGTEIRTKSKADLQWGSSPGQASGSLRWMPEGYLLATVQGQFPSMVLDEWILHWGSGRKKPDPPSLELLKAADYDQQVDLPEGRRFVLDAAIAATHATFKQFDIEKGGTAHFNYTRRKKPLNSSMRFDRINMNLYGGTGAGKVAFLFVPKAQWVADVVLNHVSSGLMVAAAVKHESTIWGILDANAKIMGRSKKTETYVGGGSFSLRDSRFMRDPIFTALGNALNSDELRDIAFSDMRGDFSLAKGIVDLKDVKFYGSLLQLEADGQMGFDRHLDVDVIYRFLGPVDAMLGRIPVLKMIPKIINRVGQILLKVHIGGTTKNPEVTVVPFSADELKIFEFEPVKPK